MILQSGLIDYGLFTRPTMSFSGAGHA